jgi:glutamyl-tRNA synthetase
MRGRFAPSPTGLLHLGNARSALLGWLQARAEGGEFLLRVEDLDRARCRPEYVDALYRDLEYLGLAWDGPVLFQSARAEAYESALSRLEAMGRIYPCSCTRQEVARAASAPHGPLDEGPVYPGTCRPPLGAARSGVPAALRFVPHPRHTPFVDGLHGPCGHDVAASVGDFVVRRNDGVASYQLAVVVDDAHQGITHVLRGDDLLSSTPRQLQLYEALGAPPPAFAHVPLLLGEDGRRLAKREGASTVAALRGRGVPADVVVGRLAAWSGLSDGSPRSAASLVPGFSLTRVRREPAVVTTGELEYILSP